LDHRILVVEDIPQITSSESETLLVDFSGRKLEKPFSK
jgi:hypothetical protein